MKTILRITLVIAMHLAGIATLMAQKGTFPVQENPLPDSLTCGVLDYGGQKYRTVKIGPQCWMAQNLNIGSWLDGSQPQKPGDNGQIQKYCYGNDFTQCDFWGGFYQWDAMMRFAQNSGAQGICPDGWHLPTALEWKELIRLLGNEDKAGGKLKSTLLWQQPNVGADNSSGFAAWPGGYFDSVIQAWADLNRQGYFWMSEMVDNDQAVAVNLTYRNSGIVRYDEFRTSALSVRCVKN